MSRRIADSYANFGTVEGNTKGIFNLSFRIQFETQFGQNMCVVGSTPELGEWKKFIGLKWTEGHVWVSERPMVIENPIFKYKYVLLENGEPRQWESSDDRVADLRIMIPQDNQLELHDTWEKFKLELALNYPGQNLFIEGITKDDIKMKNNNGSFSCCVELGQKEKLEYIYYSLNEFSKPQYERNPMSRTIRVKNNIINGVLFQHDGNFLYPKFNIHKIGDTNIFIGNYPTSEKDVQLIYDSGITQVINLLTEEQIFARQIPDLSTLY